MYVYEQKKEQSINVFLADVHKSMKIKYLNSSKADRQNAKELQDFLQGLKNAAKNPAASSGVVSSILEQIKSNRGGNYKIDKLFQRRGGKNLEDELTDIVMAVYQTATKKNFGDKNDIKTIKQSINVGTTTSTVLTGILDEQVLAVLEDMGRGVKKVLDEQGKVTKAVSGGKILVNVQQKTDVQGLNLQVSSEVPELEKILNLLNKAKISAKNYSSINKNNEDINELYDIKLGNSNPYRAFAGALSSFGYGSATINSAFYAAYRGQNEPGVKDHIYHLRYLYELTGAGSGKNIQDKGVNFLIYNDPTGDKIYVKSASEILEQALSAQVSDSPFKAIDIKKSYFRH